MKEIIYNAQTGKVTEREFTAEEIAQMELQDIGQVEQTPTLEERVASVEEITEEVVTALNQKGIVP